MRQTIPFVPAVPRYALHPALFLACAALALLANAASAAAGEDLLKALTPVTNELLAKAAPQDWLMRRGNYRAWGYSALDQIIVADPRQYVAADVSRMHDNIHVLRDRHRLVAADQRPLDQVVALAVAMKAPFLGTAMLAHEIVVGGENLRTVRARLEQPEIELACLQREGELFLEFGRSFADDASATELGIHAAWTGILDQERNDVAVFDDAVLMVALAEGRRHVRRHRSTQIDAVLATMALAVALRDGGDVAVAHSRFNGGKGGAHGAVLHRCGTADQCTLLSAFDDLDAVDQV